MKIYNFDVEFASQTKEFKTIPAGYINKRVPGCGLTTVALEDEEDVIIAVPNTSLVKNKVEQYPNERCSYTIFGVMEGVTKKDIDKYVESTNIIKIMVTYDSLYKCEHLLDRCHLIIDESNKLLGNANLKSDDKKVGEIDVNNQVLNIAEKYKDTVSFISATPIPLEYLPKWVSEIEQIEMNWANTTKAVPICMERTYPFQALKEEIIRPLRDENTIKCGDREFSKVIVFINSVENIIKIIKECRLASEEVSILCADSTRNDVKIRGYNRLIYNKLTKYNFITSSGIQGIDLYDKEAMTIAVSNTNKKHQMMDMLVELQQAISRNRDKSNPNYGRYIFIYNQSVFNQSEEEVTKIIEEIHIRISDNCNLLNRIKNDKEYESTLETFSDSDDFRKYSMLVDGVWKVNELLFSADVYFIKEIRKQFTKGFDIISNFIRPIIVEAPKKTNPYSYTNMREKFLNNLNGIYEFTEDDLVSDNYKLIKEYYDLTGKVLKDSDYCKKMLAARNNDFKQLSIIVKKLFSVGNRYSRKEIKETLNEVYSQNGITRKAKHSDLRELGIEYEDKKIRGTYYVEIIKK